MLTREHKIRLVPEFRNALLNPWFDELYRKSPSSPAKQASDDIVATAEIIFAFLTRCAEIKNPGRVVFVLVLPQVAGSFIAGLLAEELSGWLADERQRADQILHEAIAQA